MSLIKIIDTNYRYCYIEKKKERRHGMENKILNEILICVKETNQNIQDFEKRIDKKLQQMKKEIILELREEFDEKLQQMKKEIILELRKEFDEKLQQMKKEIIQQISLDVSEQLRFITEVKSKKESERDKKWLNELKKHEIKTIRGIDALKRVLVN